MSLPPNVKISSDIFDYYMQSHWGGYLYHKYMQNKNYIHFCDAEIEALEERNFLKKELINNKIIYTWKAGPFWWGCTDTSGHAISCWNKKDVICRLS